MALTQVKTTGLADDAVTLAKQAAGTDGQVITYDASGNPVAVGPGTDGQVLTSTGAGSPPAFEAIPAAGISDVVSDTSPQLGGNLDVQTHQINTSTTNGDIHIQPNGTGDLLVGNTDNGLTLRSASTTDSFVVKGSHSYIQINGGANGSIQVLPQGTGGVDLGGSTTKLGLGNTEQKLTTHMSGAHINIEPAGTSGNIKVKSGANEDIEITPNGTGDVIIAGLKYPQADGSANQLLKTNGSAQLSWVDPPAGKILGYAKTDTTTGTDCSAFASFTTISNFELTYTPTDANSKLLFMATLHLTVRAVNSSYYGNMEVQFVHGSHGVVSEKISLYQGPGSGAATAMTWPSTFIFEIDAEDTNARDITLQIHNASSTGGNNNGHLYLNEYPGRSFMSVMEIAQ